VLRIPLHDPLAAPINVRFQGKADMARTLQNVSFRPKADILSIFVNQAFIAPMKCKELLTYLRTYIASNLEDDAGDAVVSDETKGRNLSCQKEERSRQAN
jgi:hypothetical protein